MNITLHPLFLRGLWLAVTGLVFCAQAEAAAVSGQPGQQVKFNWEVIAGTCTVTTDLPSPTVAYTAADVTYPTLKNGMYTNWAAWVTAKNFNIILDCKGLGGVGKRPVVTIEGTLMVPKDKGTYDKPEDQTLFSDAGAGGVTTSQGFGFYFKKTSKYAGSSTTHNEATQGEQLYIPKGSGYYGAGDTLPATASIPLILGVSCGYESWCKPENLMAGKLKATITFDFKYQ